jgi:23S rRNA pseudouridine1911/1915/1917 synthase
VAQPEFIELGGRRRRTLIPILYEDRAVVAIDKPAGWMLVPFDWQRTPWNLQAAITSSIRSGAHWARCRNLKFLRPIHRLDAETTGILLMGRSPGAVESLGELFEVRRMDKRYLAVVTGQPKQAEWVCDVPLAPVPGHWGRMRADAKEGKEAVTRFRLLESRGGKTLLEARPLTGRTHQIRVHLLEAGCPIDGDELYNTAGGQKGRRASSPATPFPLGLRAVRLSYLDPFRHQPVEIVAPTRDFLRAFGFNPASL